MGDNVLHILKPGLGLDGVTINNANIGRVLRDDLGRDVQFTTGYLDDVSSAFYGERGFSVKIIPALDRFNPDHTAEVLTGITRQLQGTIMFSQAMQTNAFGSAALDTARRLAEHGHQGRVVLRVHNPFPRENLTILEAMPEGTKCWVVNPGYIPFLSEHNSGLDYGVMSPPLDTHRFASESSSDRLARRMQLRHLLGVGRKEIMLFQPTRVHPQKDLILSVNFARELNRQVNRPVKLVVAGGNEQLEDSRNYQRDVLEYAAMVGYSGLVIVGGVSDANGAPRRMKDFYAASDGVIIPSKLEAAPNTIAEAAYNRVPIIATKFGDEFLNDTYTPLYSEFDVILIAPDQTLWRQAERLAAILEEPGIRYDVVSRNHELAAQFSIAHLPDRLRELLA